MSWQLTALVQLSGKALCLCLGWDFTSQQQPGIKYIYLLKERKKKKLIEEEANR
jgi:hypothetical protein